MKTKMKTKILFVLFAMLSIFCHAQQSIVKGKVVGTRTDNVGIPGVNVFIKGTNVGTITDPKGNYQMKVDNGQTLVFSFIGYASSEVVYSGQSTIDVVLEEENQSVEEVVVTALGISHAKKSLGYTTQEVKPEVVTSVNAPNMGNMLTGQVAGLTVNTRTGLFQSPEFSLREKPLLL